MASSLTGISIASSYDSLLKVGDNDGLSASLQVISDGLGTETGISLNNAGDLTATGTITGNSFVGNLSGNISGNSTISGTLTFGSLSDGTITITDIKDEDNMSSNSATALATQQSIKAYVDAQVTASDLDFQGDSGGAQSIDLDTETFSIVGTTNEITTTSAGNALTIALNPNISGLTSVAATTFTGALTGNATTATTLATSRNIAGVAFNGSADISLSTDNITEGSNLYYTTARFDTALASKSTTNLSEGTNLYFTNARADARIALNTGANLDLSSKSTTDLSEGSNLYFTDERVDDRVSNLVVGGTGITATYDDAANSLTITNSSPDQTVAISASSGTGLSASGTYPNFTIAGTDASTSAKGVASFSSSHFSVSSGAVSIAADSIDDTLIDFGTGTNQVNTDDLPEGSTNKYLTNERIDDQVASLIVGGSGISATYDDAAGTLTLANTASGIGLSDFSVTDAGGDGSLSYNNSNGVFTYTGPSQSEVQAHITKSYVDGLGIAATSATTAAGLTGTPNISVGTIGASGTITGNLTGDVTGDVTGNVTGNLTGNVTGNTSGSSGSTTGNAATATALATARNISGVSFDGTADITLNTSAITENTNLYYTDSRVQAVSINNVVEDTTPQLGGNLDAQSYNITTTGKILYANMYASEGDLPSASTYHGMFAHVHGTGKGYFAHAGNWIKLIDETNSTTDNLTQGSTNLYNQVHTGEVTGGTALTIANNAVTTVKILDANVTTAKIADNNITTAKILDDNITTAKVLDANITTAKIADDAITTAKILDANVTTAKLADDSVTAAKVASDLRAVQYIGLDSTDYMQFTDNTQIDMYVNGNNQFRLEADGDGHFEGDVIAYSTTIASDERLKENVKVIENPLDKLDQLRGVTFDWIGREDKRSGGVIAQELEKVMPELVKEVDSLKNEDSFKAVDYNGLIGLLIEAVKELSDKCNNCNK
jgi:hypothetical protein